MRFFSSRMPVQFSPLSYVPFSMRCSVPIYLDPNPSKLTISHLFFFVPESVYDFICVLHSDLNSKIISLLIFSQSAYYTEMWRWWIIIRLVWWNWHSEVYRHSLVLKLPVRVAFCWTTSGHRAIEAIEAVWNVIEAVTGDWFLSLIILFIIMVCYIHISLSPGWQGQRAQTVTEWECCLVRFPLLPGIVSETDTQDLWYQINMKWKLKM